MPNAPETRRNHASGTSKPEASEQIIELFGSPVLHELAPALDGILAASGRPGRRMPYPPAAMLATMAAARAAGSQGAALRVLGNTHTWQRCREQYLKRSQTTLPPAAPHRDNVAYFRAALVRDQQRMDALQHNFQRVSLGLARRLGNLLPDVEADGTTPDERQAIYTDGTVIAPYSDVTVQKMPRTGELFTVGSRAKSVASARVQRVLSEVAEDKKTARGLNMVGAYTWTAAGRVVLGTGTALRAEAWTVLDLIDRLHEILAAADGKGGAIHTLINDRAITGWHVDYLMGSLGIQVLGKDVGRTSDGAWSVATKAQRLAAELGVDAKGLAQMYLRRTTLAEMIRCHEHLPLGTSVYPSSKKDYDLVASWSKPLPAAVHEVNGQRCEHELAIDDGGLFLTDNDPDTGSPVKTAFLRCSSNTRHLVNGTWQTTSTYRIPCVGGDFDYTRVWAPNGTRYTDASQTKAPTDPIGWRLRPLSRADDVEAYYNEGVDMRDITVKRFSQRFSRRNDAESYNEWFQSSLPHHGRASTDVVPAQELDFLLAAVLNNSRTLANDRRLKARRAGCTTTPALSRK